MDGSRNNASRSGGENKKLDLPVGAFGGFGLGINEVRTDGATFTIPECDGVRNSIGLAARINWAIRVADPIPRVSPVTSR